MINWKLLKTFCFILGILSIIMAITVYSGSVGYTESFKSYGGDAYTGIQNAGAQAANNIKYLGETIRSALGSFLLIQGLCMLLGSFCIKKAPKAAVAAVAPVAPVVPVAPVYQNVVPVAPQPTYQPVAPQPVAPQPAAPQASSWLCMQCGRPNAEGNNFCQHCGTARQ